jgi:DNA glycosylase AlkZ-like
VWASLAQTQLLVDDHDSGFADRLRINRHHEQSWSTTPRCRICWAFGVVAHERWTIELFASLASELQLVDVEGAHAWVVAEDTLMLSDRPGGVRVLPYFDAYVVGCHPRELLFPGRVAEHGLAGGQAGNFPVLLIDDVVGGVWHHRRAGGKLVITVKPLKTLATTQRRDLDEQVERVGAILESRPQVTIGTVRVGAHA